MIVCRMYRVIVRVSVTSLLVIVEVLMYFVGGQNMHTDLFSCVCVCVCVCVCGGGQKANHVRSQVC
jgi:heme O synthase-like polyprenyltransferase